VQILGQNLVGVQIADDLDPALWEVCADLGQTHGLGMIGQGADVGGGRECLVVFGPFLEGVGDIDHGMPVERLGKNEHGVRQRIGRAVAVERIEGSLEQALQFLVPGGVKLRLRCRRRRWLVGGLRLRAGFG